MIKLKKTLFIICLLLSAPAFAATDSTSVQPATIKTPKIFLWETGIITFSAPVNSNYSLAVSNNPCPAGLNPYYNVAEKQGYISPSKDHPSDDKGIRGIHLSTVGCSQADGAGVSHLCAASTDNLTHQIYITFSQAYLDTIDTGDKPLTVSYWIYCGQ